MVALLSRSADILKRRAVYFLSGLLPGASFVSAASDPTCSAEGCNMSDSRWTGTAIPGSPVGVEISGVDLREKPSAEIIKSLEMQMAEHGFIVFRDQQLSGDDQVRISAYFGGKEIHSTHGVHPRAPNRHIFRLSNDPEIGILGVGPQWHNDGSFVDAVFSHVGYYMVKAPTEGGKAYDNLSEEEKDKWSNYCSINSNGGAVHPMVYEHELTGKKHVYLHLGMTGAILDCRKIKEKLNAAKASGTKPEAMKPGDAFLLNRTEMRAIFNRYNDLLNDPSIHRKHPYKTNDLVMIDNLSVAHKADPSAHIAVDGDEDNEHLRILHRSTVAGTHIFEAKNLLPGVRHVAIDGPNPFNSDGVWEAGGLGFRWDETIRMQN